MGHNKTSAGGQTVYGSLYCHGVVGNAIAHRAKLLDGKTSRFRLGFYLQGYVGILDGNVVGCVGGQIKQRENVCVEGAHFLAVKQNCVVALGVVWQIVLPLQAEGC